jgi:hypothetical protein
MKPKGQNQPVRPQNQTALFSVWADEGGEPKFPDASTPVLSSNCFIWVDPARRPDAGDYVLVSEEGRMFFDRLIQKNGCLSLKNHLSGRIFDSSLLILGVVVSGIEWFAIPEDE